MFDLFRKKEKRQEPARKENPGLMRAMEANIIFDLYKEQSEGAF